VQDIALRGHGENKKATASDSSQSQNRENFVEILEVVKQESVDVRMNLERLPLNATYCSKDSQNELLQAGADVMLRTILSEVKTSFFFTVIADEARDLSHTEQLSICLRYVVGCTVKERFLSFVQVQK
jgi:hypothetical protein